MALVVPTSRGRAEAGGALASARLGRLHLESGDPETLRAVLLLFTGTKPPTHKLDELVKLVSPLHSLLAEPFPMATEQDEHVFNLLRRAYIEARYSKSYRITAEQLTTLGERVKDLVGCAERVCKERIEGTA